LPDDSGPRKKTKHLDDPHVLTYIFELYKQIVKQFPDMPDSQLIDEQPTMLAEAESDSAEQTAEYTEKALLLREWLEDVNNKQHKIADKDLADEEDRKVLQAILHEEDMRRHDLTSLEECFIVLSHNPHASSRIEDDLRPVNITRQFDGSLRAVRLCLVTVMLNEADEMLSRGNGVVGDRKKFEDALEEQEQFFAENNHLENAKGILNEVQDSNVSETQRDINSQTKVLRQQMDSISFKEPQVHSRLTSGIAAWKQYDVHYTDLELGADQCKKRLDEFQGTPMATSPQEVADGITQLNNICENNNQLFSKAGALREQVDLLAAFATSEQRTSISNDARVLSDSLEKTSTTIKDLKNTLQEQLIKDWEQRINNLDAKLIRLPAVEYDMKCLSALSESIEAIADEFSICRRELDSLKKAAMDIEGFFNDSGTEQLQALDSHLDKFAANVAGKRAEIAASARMTEKVAKMLNDVENELKAVSSNTEDDLQDQVGVLELSAVQDHFNNLQTCCQQLQELLPKLEDALKPFPVRGGPSTKALEMRAEALSSQIENAVNRASSQLETLTDIRDKLSQMEVETNGLSLWADKANETLALGSVPLTQLEELESEVEEKKPLFSGINATANDLTATYPSMDNQYLSNSMLAVRTKLQKVQDTLVAKHREQSSWKISCLDVLTFLVVVVSAAVG
jgi:DNA repair exonuclease SbcCD ATPase subunit